MSDSYILMSEANKNTILIKYIELSYILLLTLYTTLNIELEHLVANQLKK